MNFHVIGNADIHNNTSNFTATVVKGLFFLNGARSPQSQECLRSMRVRLCLYSALCQPQVRSDVKPNQGLFCMCNLNGSSVIFLQLYFPKATPILVFYATKF